jgi:hypothetical protein
VVYKYLTRVLSLSIKNDLDSPQVDDVQLISLSPFLEDYLILFELLCSYFPHDDLEKRGRNVFEVKDVLRDVF